MNDYYEKCSVNIGEDPMDKAFGDEYTKNTKDVFLHVSKRIRILNAHGLYYDCDACKANSEEA